MRSLRNSLLAVSLVIAMVLLGMEIAQAEEMGRNLENFFSFESIHAIIEQIF